MKRLRLNCNDCGAFTAYDREPGDPPTVVRCDGCGKRHSTDSVYLVDPRADHPRDDRGALTETPY